ncbi:zinc finger protein 521 [Lingula anatina]|uniref:Zinc finger protein 521 n=1 Tax=Lingula anatina TaxID=7574 RepID=A0A1S3HUE4_LINAN|nr:zinc finger protein 521 [Lingula anatina]|eukprot:XP_013389665.1 zinc finger protein 521 [Lingula anatina]
MSSSEEDDIHQCGRCRKLFMKLEDYLQHKKSKICKKLSSTSQPLLTEQKDSDCQNAVDKRDELPEESNHKEVATAVKPQGRKTRQNKAPESPKDEENNVVLGRRGRKRKVKYTDLSEDGDLEPPPKSPKAQKRKRGRPRKTHSKNNDNRVKQPQHIKNVCETCGYKAMYQWEYDHHMARAHGVGTANCAQCQAVFPNVADLTEHLHSCPGSKDANNQTDRDSPSGAGTTVTAEKTTGLQDTPAGTVPEFQCTVCSSSYNEYRLLRDHLKEKHPEVNPCLCMFCGKWYRLKSHLWRHITVEAHSNLSSKEIEIARIEFEKCTRVRGPNKKNLRKQNEQSATIQRRSSYVCSFCNESFPRKVLLIRHSKLEHTEKPALLGFSHTCTWCGHNFWKRSILLDHCIKVHKIDIEADLTDICPVCNKGLKSKYHVIRHRDNLHTPIGATEIRERNMFEVKNADSETSKDETVENKQVEEKKEMKKTDEKDKTMPTVETVDTEDMANSDISKKDEDLEGKCKSVEESNRDFPNFRCFVCHELFTTNNSYRHHLECHRIWIPRDELNELLAKQGLMVLAEGESAMHIATPVGNEDQPEEPVSEAASLHTRHHQDFGPSAPVALQILTPSGEDTAGQVYYTTNTTLAPAFTTALASAQGYVAAPDYTPVVSSAQQVSVQQVDSHGNYSTIDSSAIHQWAQEQAVLTILQEMGQNSNSKGQQRDQVQTLQAVQGNPAVSLHINSASQAVQVTVQPVAIVNAANDFKSTVLSESPSKSNDEMNHGTCNPGQALQPVPASPSSDTGIKCERTLSEIGLEKTSDQFVKQSGDEEEDEEQEEEGKEDIIEDTRYDYMCPACLKVFHKLETINAHKKNVHSLVAVFRCAKENCRQIFLETDDFIDHHKVHPQQAFICRICNEHVESLNNLIGHKVVAHKDIYPSYGFRCKLCHKAFKSQDQLDVHMATASHEHQCPQCGKVFKAQSELKDHELKHAGIRSFLCDICGVSFVNHAALRKHKSNHNPSRTFVCSECGNKFHKREHLNRHYRTKHSDERPFKCPEPGCPKAFKRGDKLREHLRNHSNETPYVCQHCAKAYKHKEALKYHEKTHMTVPVLKHHCEVCNASFIRAAHLANHMQQDHKMAKKRIASHECPTCKIKFHRQERLNRHMEREHRSDVMWKVTCRLCGKGFAGDKSLQTHIEKRHSAGVLTKTRRKKNQLPEDQQQIQSQQQEQQPSLQITASVLPTPMVHPAPRYDHTQIPVEAHLLTAMQYMNRVEPQAPPTSQTHMHLHIPQQSVMSPHPQQLQQPPPQQHIHHDRVMSPHERVMTPQERVLTPHEPHTGVATQMLMAHHRGTPHSQPQDQPTEAPQEVTHVMNPHPPPPPPPGYMYYPMQGFVPHTYN